MADKIKRFYESVEVKPRKDGFVVELDGRPIKSPGKQVVLLPREDLAQKVAEEWRRQKKHINLAFMPSTRFAGGVMDKFMPNPEEARAEIIKYAHSDLLCYRVEGPSILVNRQKRWDEVLDQLHREENIAFKTSIGISYIDQDKQDLTRFSALVEPLAGFELAAVHALTVLGGSAVLAMALYKGWLDHDTVWELCHLDEDYQAECWGRDAEAQKTRQRNYVQFRAATFILETE